ncbi:MAG: hypothetical protein AB1488_01705, partial [Nitrospirota bacterium]
FPFNYADAEQIQTESGLFLVEIHIEKGGLKIGGNKPIKLILRDSSGNPIEGAFIKATPWCAEHGHGSSKQTIVREKDRGLYIIDNIYLQMKTKWNLIVEIKYKNKEDSVAIPLPKVK